MAYHHKGAIELPDDEVDLNPLIDVITMLIIFFILGGKLTQDVRTEQITVPPTKTGQAIKPLAGWTFITINVFGHTQGTEHKASGGLFASSDEGSNPEVHIQVGTHSWVARGVDNYKAYQGLRTMLNAVYDRADHYLDPKGSGINLPKVTLEIRADADTQYRVVQEIEQIVSDTIDPFKQMQARNVPPASMKPFVSINFTTRNPPLGSRDSG